MLKTSKDQLHKLIGSSSEAMLIVDSRGNIVHCNKALEKLFGYKAGDLTGAELDTLVPERFRKKHVKHRENFFSEAAIRPMSTGLDLYGYQKDGTEFPVEISLHPFETEDGSLVYATIRDVSVLKHTQDLLVAAIEGLPEGFSYYDADDRLAIFNTKMADIYPLIGDVYQIGTTFEEVLRTGIERGQFVEAQGREEEFYKEKLAYHRDPKGAVEYTLPDGRWVRVEEKKTPEGGVVGIRTDITEQKKTEELIRKNDELMTAALEGMPEGFAYFDKDDRLAIFNKRFIQFYPLVEDVVKIGTPYEVVLRTGIERGQFIDPQGRKEEYFKERLGHHRDPKGPVEFMMPDDRCIRVEERKLPGGGIVGIRTDITDEKNIEKELQAQRDELAKLNEQKDRFFMIIAHDLRSPFNALLGYSEFLSMQANSMDRDKIAEYGTLIHQAADQAFKLLEDLLDWSRLQLDRMEIEPEPLNMKEIIDANLARFEPVATAKNIQINSNVARKLIVHADARMINTILRNLINNAIKFTPQQGVVDVNADQKNAIVEIEVADTGVGMGEDKVANLFRLGKKMTSTGTEGETGTGLGLLLCKELVEKLGGMIYVDSIKGNGSSIRFTLPQHCE